MKFRQPLLWRSDTYSTWPTKQQPYLYKNGHLLLAGILACSNTDRNRKHWHTPGCRDLYHIHSHLHPKIKVQTLPYWFRTWSLIISCLQNQLSDSTDRVDKDKPICPKKTCLLPGQKTRSTRMYSAPEFHLCICQCKHGNSSICICQCKHANICFELYMLQLIKNRLKINNSFHSIVVFFLSFVTTKIHLY